MENKFQIPTLIFTILAMLSCGTSFDKALCGEPEGKQKTFIDSINLLYKEQLTISHMPCYSDYMKVNLKANYHEVLIDSLENSYKRLVNFAEFLVYDKEGKLIRGNTGSM